MNVHWPCFCSCNFAHFNDVTSTAKTCWRTGSHECDLFRKPLHSLRTLPRIAKNSSLREKPSSMYQLFLLVPEDTVSAKGKTLYKSQLLEWLSRPTWWMYTHINSTFPFSLTRRISKLNTSFRKLFTFKTKLLSEIVVLLCSKNRNSLFCFPSNLSQSLAQRIYLNTVTTQVFVVWSKFLERAKNILA